MFRSSEMETLVDGGRATADEPSFLVALRRVSKRYANGFQALKGVDLTIGDGEFVSLPGPRAAESRRCCV